MSTGSSDRTTEVRLEFPHLFEVEVLKEIPGRGADLRYFPAARLHGLDGVLLRVNPEGAASWSGMFAALPTGRYKSGVYSCPNESALCVVSNGAGYVVDVRDPDAYQEVPVTPVLEVVPAADEGLLLFANYTDVLAWDNSGYRWRAGRVSFDGIRSLRAKSGILNGIAWSPEDGEHPFALDLATGASLPPR